LTPDSDEKETEDKVDGTVQSICSSHKEKNVVKHYKEIETDTNNSRTKRKWLDDL